MVQESRRYGYLDRMRIIIVVLPTLEGRAALKVGSSASWRQAAPLMHWPGAAVLRRTGGDNYGFWAQAWFRYPEVKLDLLDSIFLIADSVFSIKPPANAAAIIPQRNQEN